MKGTEDRSAPLLAPERSVRVAWSANPGPVWWGATWATLCGAAAALPWAAGPGGLVDLAVVWAAAVVLLGAYWATALGGAEASLADAQGGPLVLPMPRPSWPRRARALAEQIRGSVRIRRRADAVRLGSAAAAVVLAASLSLSVAILVAAGALVGWWAERRAWRPSIGVARTLLEIGVPAGAAYTALGGWVPVPAAIAVDASLAEVTVVWGRSNWPFIAVLAGLLLVHHGATAITRKGDLSARHAELVAGYAAVVTVLVVVASPLAAGAAALLFILQWPFQAAFRHGKVRWHLLETQAFAMAATLVACLGLAAQA